MYAQTGITILNIFNKSLCFKKIIRHISFFVLLFNLDDNVYRTQSYEMLYVFVCLLFLVLFCSFQSGEYKLNYNMFVYVALFEEIKTIYIRIFHFYFIEIYLFLVKGNTLRNHQPFLRICFVLHFKTSRFENT